MKIKKNGKTNFDIFAKRLFAFSILSFLIVSFIFVPLITESSNKIAQTKNNIETLENNKNRLEYSIKELIDSDQIFQALQKMLNNN